MDSVEVEMETPAEGMTGRTAIMKLELEPLVRHAFLFNHHPPERLETVYKPGDTAAFVVYDNDGVTVTKTWRVVFVPEDGLDKSFIWNPATQES